VERRCKELNITELHQGVSNKKKVFEDVLARRKKSLAQTAVMGDDLVDLPLMMKAGISAAPANATREVRVRSSIVTHAGGGAGAVREFAELILKAQDKWHDILEDYLE
jgi:3-deoxy-D-manno-octulosonate 8-phosphate phosphatase (KDO 8-P phosphatase)